MNRKELMHQSQSVTQIATDLIKNTNTPSFTVILMQQFTNSIITTGGLIDAICMDYASVNTPKRLNTAIEELHKAIHIIQMLSQASAINVTLAKTFFEQSSELVKLILTGIYEFQNRKISIQQDL